MHHLKAIADFLLFLTCPLVLGLSLLLTIKTRFIQFRKLPYVLRQLFSFSRNKSKEGKATVKAHHALFTAMSTTLGISTIVSPVIAIRLGGPGAVLGFFLATILGAAVNFAEVTFALSYRKHHPKSGIAGGPMQYMQEELHPLLAKSYALCAFILLISWSAAQANQLANIFDSPFLPSFHVPSWITGLLLALFVIFLLVGGIKRIANFSAKLVPIMFCIYVGGALWIILCNLEKLPAIVHLIISSAFAPHSFASGVTVGGLAAAIRWGVFKGLQSNEAGVGTQTFPHSMSETENPFEQGILSMIATYSAGFICILSCLVTLMTETWLDSSLPLGINMVVASFTKYFSSAGAALVIISALFFAFGTILGNSFNGGQCFNYLSKNRFQKFYYFSVAFLIFWGCVADVTTVWSIVDYLLVPVIVPHIFCIAYLSYKQKDLLLETASVSVSV